MSHQGYHKRTQFMSSFRVMQYDSLYDSSIMQQSDLHYLVFVGPRNYRTETMFSIFKLKKIDQNGLKLDIQKLFYTKSSTQIPMSWSIFSNRIVWKILETKVESYQCVETLSKKIRHFKS